MMSLFDTPKAIQIKSYTKIFNTSDDVSKDAIFAALVYNNNGGIRSPHRLGFPEA